MSDNVTFEIDTKDVEKGLQLAIDAIRKGANNSVKEIQSGTYDYAKKRLDLFKHTPKKESYHGLIKPPITYMRTKTVARVTQKSQAGIILEYKLKPSSRHKGGFGGAKASTPWFISTHNPGQKKSHSWLRSNTNNGFAAIRFDSQISRMGPKADVKPMTNAFDKFTLTRGPEIVIEEVIKELKRKLG